ncbi:folylpolyglutamate synthase, mitochondrial-like [Argonauta hians]
MICHLIPSLMNRRIHPAVLKLCSVKIVTEQYRTMVDAQQLATSTKVCSSVRDFQDACTTLQNLQSVLTVREKAVKHAYYELTQTKKEFLCLGMTLKDLDRLSVIHVAGTKGKGSTCAYTESILRNCGYKTGLFSSPHLVDVRERIQINGRLLSRAAFTRYLFEVYDCLSASMQNGEISEMPHYFRFLTLMAFYVFLKEEVDVAVLEVGIGGMYDCTNIIRSTVVCGISLLDYDHEQILGSTIDSIAWQKAGIFKPHVPAITLPQQQKAMNVLIERAQEINNPLYTISEKIPGLNKNVSCLEPCQLMNISLAIQLARVWLSDHHRSDNQRQWFGDCNVLLQSTNIPVLDCDFQQFSMFSKGIKNCHVPGRLQIIKHKSVSFYLDGAHTVESINNCTNWFLKHSYLEIINNRSNMKPTRVLMFNVSGGRKPKRLLSVLNQCSFDVVIFVPSIQHNPEIIKDLGELATLENLEHCRDMQHAWYDLHQEISKCEYSTFKSDSTGAITCICPSVNDALYWCSSDIKNLVKPSYKLNGVPTLLKEATHIQLLVTGSILLVGKLLSFFNPTEI